MDYVKLKQSISSLSGTDEEVAALLNIKDIPATQNISVADIKKYLIVTGKILAIRASVEPAAMLTIEAINAFTEFVMSDPLNASALNAQLDGLIAASLLTTADKITILSLKDTLESLADQNGFGIVRTGDIFYARSI